MTTTETQNSHRVLLVDDDDSIRLMMTATLERKGFEVVSAANVSEALRLITTDKFDALISDLHMPNPADGFTVISAMRHSQPEALTLLVSGYPDVQSAMATIMLEPDEIIVKPFEIERLADLIRQKISTRRPAARINKERVATILERSVDGIVQGWLTRVNQNNELSTVALSHQERTGYLPQLIEDLITRLSSSATTTEGNALCSPTAAEHGKLRRKQGYTPGMLVQDSRILQVTLFGTLHDNLGVIDFSLLLPDVMAIADEVDSQLTQSMDGYMAVADNPVAA